MLGPGPITCLEASTRSVTNWRRASPLVAEKFRNRHETKRYVGHVLHMNGSLLALGVIVWSTFVATIAAILVVKPGSAGRRVGATRRRTAP